MASIRFEWDIRKNRLNQRKHGVSFEEAQSVFLDDDALLIISARKADSSERALYAQGTRT